MSPLRVTIFSETAHHVFPRLGVAGVGVEPRRAEDLLVEVDGPVGQLQRQAVDLALDCDRVEHVRDVGVDDLLRRGEPEGLGGDRRNTGVGDVGVLVLDRHVEDVGSFVRREGGEHGLLDLGRGVEELLDRDVRVLSLELRDVTVLDDCPVLVLVGPEQELDRPRRLFLPAFGKSEGGDRHGECQQCRETHHVEPPCGLIPASL